MPPLLNDFIALQKDVALVSIIGPQEAFRVAQIFSRRDFNYTPLLAARDALPLRDDSARPASRPMQVRGRRERGGRARARAPMSAVLELRGVTKCLRGARGAARDRPRRRRASRRSR